MKICISLLILDFDIAYHEFQIMLNVDPVYV